MDSSFGTSFAISKLCQLIGIGLHLLPSFHSHRCVALFAHPLSPPRSCWRRGIEIARVRIQAPIFISWRRYRSGIFASSLNYALLLLASCGFKQKPLLFEQPSWVGAKVQSKSSGSVLFVLVSNGFEHRWSSSSVYPSHCLCLAVIGVRALSAYPSHYLHLATIWRVSSICGLIFASQLSVFLSKLSRTEACDFRHSDFVPMSRVFPCWLFVFAKLKEELCYPWSSKSSWPLVLIYIPPRWTPRKNKHWLVNCLLLLIRECIVLAFILVWQLRCTLNTCLKIQCPTWTHGSLV